MVPAEIKQVLITSFCTWVEPSKEGEELIDDDTFVTWPKFVGDRILFWGKKKSYWPYQCFLGTDWPIVVLTYFLIVVINVVVLTVIAPLGWYVVLAGSISCAILLIFYSATVATNPGIIYETREDIVDLESSSCDNSANLESESHQPMLGLELTSTNIAESTEEHNGNAATISILGGDQNSAVVNPIDDVGVRPPAVPSTIECGQCKIQRPYTARHCYYCKVCINELDHHCPWCGQCIGEENMKFFQCFVGWLSFQCYFLLCSFLYFVVVVVSGVNFKN